MHKEKGNGVQMNEKKIWIVTDSNSGISIEEEKKYNIGIVSMPFIIDGREFYENLTIDRPTFFEYLEKNADVKTSQPSIDSLMNIFRNGLKDNDEIIYIPMSSELSGSVMTARSIAEEFDGRVHVVDNHRISCTQKQSVLEAAALAGKGYSTGEICGILEEHKYDVSIYIAVDTLEYLKRGGRITKTAAAIGNVLDIKPVLQIQGGKLEAYKKARGRKAAQRIMLEAVETDIKERFEGREVLIKGAYCGDKKAADEWEEKIKNRFPDYDISLDPLALSICCHIGPGALAIVCMEKLQELTPNTIMEE